MTSQFPTPPADATRLLLVLDAPLGDARGEALSALAAGYAPVLIAADADAGVARRIAQDAGAAVEVDVRFGRGGGGEAALGAVRGLLATHAGACIVVVAGEEVLRVLLCEALGVPLAAAWRFRIAPGAVTVVEVGTEGRWALVRLNEERDLPAG